MLGYVRKLAMVFALVMVFSTQWGFYLPATQVVHATTKPYESSVQDKISKVLSSQNGGPVASRFLPWQSGTAIAPMHAQAKMLVIAVAFRNQKQEESLQMIDSLYFAMKNSVASYYRQVSYGQFDLQGNVVGDPLHHGRFLTLPHTESYYAGLDNGSGSPYPNDDDGIVNDAIRLLRKDGFNFQPYVENGQIPYLSLVFTGYGADVDPTDAALVWPVESTLGKMIRVPYMPVLHTVSSGQHQTTMAYANIVNYDLVPELSDQSGAPSTIGVYAHEFGHLLGLDDLYDTSSSDQAGQGDGPWSIMAQGNWNGNPQGAQPAELDPLSRILLGWVKPIVIRESITGLTIPPIESSPTVYALMPSGTQKDYFLLDNVEPISDDVALPGFGLLIWHIDGRMATFTSPDWVNNVLNSPSQNKTHHDDVMIEEANGSKDLLSPSGEISPGTDTYPSLANNQFTATSKPNNLLWDGQSVGIDLTNISVNSNMVTVDVLDKQSGASLVIQRPNKNLNMIRTQRVTLHALYTEGGHTVDVSHEGVFSVMAGGAILHGNVATFTQDGTVIISVFARHLTSLIYLHVMG